MLFLPDMPKGPLDEFRKRASFDWKKLKIFLDGEEIVKFKYDIWDKLAADPLFDRPALPLLMDEYRRLTTLRFHRVRDYNFLTDEEVLSEPKKFVAIMVALNEWDPSLLLKYAVPLAFFPAGVRGMGSAKHAPYLAMATSGAIKGCFCLTEIGHGSNAANMQTTATWCPQRAGFLLHTPSFEAAKCWAGSLGKSSSHGLVYAQLITADGQRRGLHGFVVPLRDGATMRPLPGVTLGDMGHKCGLNAIDNGFAMFDHYFVPREALLDRSAQVTPEGEYVSRIQDPRKRHGAGLGVLVGGRVTIVNISAANLAHASIIATRYSAVRTQFGEPGAAEMPVLEYQLQQCRVLPLLAASLALKSMGAALFDAFMQLNFALATHQPADDLGAELHALAAAAKPLASWTAQRGIQDCRESCGGHGYLSCAGLGRLRDDNDANCTYEGENQVLLMQASGHLLALSAAEDATDRESPLGSTVFLQATPQRCAGDLRHPTAILSAYEWLLQWLVAETAREVAALRVQGASVFNARSRSQAFRARTLALAYAEYYAVRCLWEQCCSDEAEPELRTLLTRVCTLYGLWSLEKHLATLYQSDFAGSVDVARMVRDGVAALSAELAVDAVALADALAPPDAVLDSVLGAADGQVYLRLRQAFLSVPGATERPAWWRETVEATRSRL